MPDIATLLGLLGALGIVGFAISGGSGGVGLFINIPSLLIVIIGSAFVVLMKFGAFQFLGGIKVALKAFFFKTEKLEELIQESVALAEVARVKGIVALEDEDIKHGFLREGIRRVVDNMDPGILRNLLNTDMAQAVERHETGRKIFEALGDVGPAMGMIGTLVGLVQMLASMEDPKTIGPAMAVALLTTLYGAMLANMFALPIADKLALRSQQERNAKMLLIHAVASIQKGVHPRVLHESLLVYLPGSKRPKEEDD